jgi:hypothetical protein
MSDVTSAIALSFRDAFSMVGQFLTRIGSKRRGDWKENVRIAHKRTRLPVDDFRKRSSIEVPSGR